MHNILRNRSYHLLIHRHVDPAGRWRVLRVGEFICRLEAVEGRTKIRAMHFVVGLPRDGPQLWEHQRRRPVEIQKSWLH